MVVLKYSHSYNESAYFKCICDCGKFKTTRSSVLNKGKIGSCGCLVIEKIIKNIKTHGMSRTRIYRIWAGMLGRCENIKNDKYEYYGGRGIKVCERWHLFINFYNDTKEGYKDNLSLDRYPKLNGDYEPNNFRWATMKEQSRNTRRNMYLEYNGERLTYSEWAERLGMEYKCLQNRVNYGWPTERILTEPVLFCKGKNQFSNKKIINQCQESQQLI